MARWCGSSGHDDSWRMNNGCSFHVSRAFLHQSDAFGLPSSPPSPPPHLNASPLLFFFLKAAKLLLSSFPSPSPPSISGIQPSLRCKARQGPPDEASEARRRNGGAPLAVCVLFTLTHRPFLPALLRSLAPTRARISTVSAV